jgi:AcrR family transcriptional regulator
MASQETRKRRTRADGERSYRTILDTAARLATTEGLEGLSIGRLAGEIGMSKSGLYAHFDSKQQLQLATVGAAEDVFTAEVVTPALEVPEGLGRLKLLCAGFLSYVKRGVFPGGCFFLSTAAEWDTRQGPIRDRVRTVLAGWTQLLEANLREAQQQGDLASEADTGQLTFEINALLHEANSHYLLFRDATALERARRAIDDRLTSAQR